MLGDIDFSRLDMTIPMEDMTFRIIEAEKTVFRTDFPNHMHSFYELHYISGGHGTLISKGATYDLRKGTLYLTGPKIPHAQLTDPVNFMEEYAFSFDISFGRSKKSSPFSGLLQSADFWIVTDTSQIDKTFSDIVAEAENKNPGYIYMLKSLFEQLIIKMLRNIRKPLNTGERRENLPDDRRKFLIDRAFIYHYKDITLTSLAKLLNLSSRQTGRIIRQEYGMSFLELRTKSRLDAACVKLQSDHQKSIRQIAEEVGFDDTAYFSRQFLSAYGITPSDFRSGR